MPPTHSSNHGFDPDREGPGEHDIHLLFDENDSVDLVPCPCCGRAVNAHARDCHRCGEAFGCEAWQAQGKPRHKLWLWVAIGLLAMMLFMLVSYGTIF